MLLYVTWIGKVTLSRRGTLPRRVQGGWLADTRPPASHSSTKSVAAAQRTAAIFILRREDTSCSDAVARLRPENRTVRRWAAMRFRGFRAAAALALLVLLLFVAHATGDVGSEAPGRAQCRAPPLRPRLVLGADGRQRIVNMAAPPYNSVVQLSMGTIGGNTSCSGVLITRELVLTAASCIFLPRDLARGIAKPSWVSSVRAGLGGFRGDRTAAGIGVSSLHVPTRYLSAASTVGYSREASESDFAVLRLLRAVDASILIPGRLGMAAYNGGGTVLGFPSNKAGLWSARCQLGITGTRASEWIACDMSSGQEGGPVLRDRLPTVAGSTPASLIGIVVRTPDGSSLNRIAVLNKDAETFIRNVISLPSDPCLLRGRTCSRNALCTTNSTRATCTCLPGLFGDGYSCSTDVCLARGLKCSVNGYCWDTGDIPRCRCNSGFIGDGVTCVLPTTSKTATASSTATRTRTTRTRSATRTRRLTTSRSHTTDESPREPTFTINVIPPSSTTATRTSYTETTTQTSNTRTTSSITTSTPNPCVRISFFPFWRSAKCSAASFRIIPMPSPTSAQIPSSLSLMR